MNNPVLPKNVALILDEINEAGFEAYIVGGCVRDCLMGRAPHDWDMTTSATPEEVKGIFRHTVDTGIKHGTVTVVKDGVNYEITTYRVEGEYEDCRHPSSVSFTRDLHEDLLRRDFTVNAIAYCPKEGYVDIFGGWEDIKNKVIRGVGEPGERFREDALRMLRAVRFSVQLDFEIEENTKKAIAENGGLIKKISAERIREELTKTITADYVERMTAVWETGLLSHLNTELSKSVEENSENIVKQLRRIEKDTAMAYTVLLRYMSLNEAKAFLKYLKFDTKTLRSMEKLLENININIDEEEIPVRLQASRLGKEDCRRLYTVKKAAGCVNAEEALFALNRIITRGDPLAVKDLDITGETLMEMGIPAGKDIGAVLNYLLNEVLKNPSLNTRDSLRELAGGFYFGKEQQ